MVCIPVPRNPEEARVGLIGVQAAIEDINDHILLLEIDRKRYEQVGHMLVGLMMEVDDGTSR